MYVSNIDEYGTNYNAYDNSLTMFWGQFLTNDNKIIAIDKENMEYKKKFCADLESTSQKLLAAEKSIRSAQSVLRNNIAVFNNTRPLNIEYKYDNNRTF